jgi:hypothetical protein
MSDLADIEPVDLVEVASPPDLPPDCVASALEPEPGEGDR